VASNYVDELKVVSDELSARGFVLSAAICMASANRMARMETYICESAMDAKEEEEEEEELATAHIENWFHYADGLCGKITGHPKQDTFKTDCQWTSRVTSMSEEEGWAISASGVRYTLGKKSEG